MNLQVMNPQVMNPHVMNLVAAWLLTLALHASTLLLLALAIDRACPGMRGAWRELLWRSALFGGALTATLQLASTPLAGRWQLELPVRQMSAQVSSASLPSTSAALVALVPGTVAPPLNVH